MPGLILKLSPQERFVVNGVVIENGDRRAKLGILTPDSNVLRLRDAIHPDEANTPVSRVCYILQLILAGEADTETGRAQALAGIEQLRAVFVDAASCASLNQAASDVEQGRFYPALRALRSILPTEEHLMALSSGKMTFSPLIVGSGIVGLKLLTDTQATQREVFDRQPEITRDVAYFTENIANVRTAEDLVSDRRLLRVALGAFGMDEEINKGAFLRKILEEGSEDPQSFANRLVDTRYVNFAEAFGFGNLIGARTGFTGFAAEITDAYKERQFERAVGEQDESLRLALNFRREIQTYATANDPENTAWFSVMGDRPVRAVFEAAFGLSTSFGQLDVDRQRDELKDLNNKFFGSKSLEVFQDSAEVEKVITRFLARRAIDEGPSINTPGFAALTLLSNASNGIGSQGIQNIILSSS